LYHLPRKLTEPDRDVDDASQVEPLLDRIAEPVELFMGDGGYDPTP